MKTVYVVVFLLLSCGGSADSNIHVEVTACEAGWSYLGGKCYKIFHDYLNWYDSDAACRQKDADLASITSSREQQFVAGLMGGMVNNAWVGARKLTEDQWVWSDARSWFDDIKWGTGQPDNWAYFEDCGELWKSYERGDLNDQLCDPYTQPYICMKTVSESYTCPDYLVTGPLGVEDSQLTASSVFSQFPNPLGFYMANHGPERARLNTVYSWGVYEEIGGWAPGLDDEMPYLQVFLNNKSMVRGVATQGRSRDHYGEYQWVTKYRLLYSLDCVSFVTAKDGNGNDKVFNGNEDPETVVTNMLDSPIIAKCVRINPTDWFGASVLRFDLIGCPVNTGSVDCSDYLVGGPNGVTDSQLTASSVFGQFYFNLDHGPQWGRLFTDETESHAGAWVAGINDQDQYIQVILNSVSVVYGVVTQTQEQTQWVSTYYLKYSSDCVNYVTARDVSGNDKLFSGNTYSESIVTNMLERPIIAKCVRVNPQAWWNDYIALRFDLLGCPVDTVLTSHAGMESCYTTFEGPYGEKKTTAADGSQQCQYQTDIYGNFSPTRFLYDVLANFETQTWNAPSTYGIFYKFGITDVRLKLLHISEFTAEVSSQYIGCFQDSPSGNFEGGYEQLADNTPSNCIEKCVLKGYAYAGVQHGTFCHCGSSYGQFGALPESACNVPCTGDAHQTCGGSWSSSVYNTISHDELKMVSLLTDDNLSQDVYSIFSDEGTITLFDSHLQEHESLCLEYIAYAGGYLKPQDPPEIVALENVGKTEAVCYHFDATAPRHCFAAGVQCDADSNPLMLETRISRSPNIAVRWKGWFDPSVDGKTVHQSGLESYTVVVNEVVTSDTTLKVDTSNVFSETVNINEGQITLAVDTFSPKLFCVTLEVKDIADNIGKARRFFLYDDTSYILSSIENEFYFISGEVDTDYKWQTHHNDTCVIWTDHFYNPFYLDNNLLSEVERDPQEFSGIYEQIDGLLPVSGTPNVHGIVNFTVSYAQNDSVFSPEIEVTDFESQAYCLTLNPKDGDTYAVKVRAIDIVGNTYAENRTIHIDSSLPEINNTGLVKGGQRVLSVHGEIDLSTMKLELEAYDLHSGIKVVEWEFYESDNDGIIDTGSIDVLLIDRVDCPSEPPCYCPVIGDACEYKRYSILLDGIVSKFNHTGHHNRNYFFKIRAVNNANLVKSEQIDILMDDSATTSSKPFSTTTSPSTASDSSSVSSAHSITSSVIAQEDPATANRGFNTTTNAPATMPTTTFGFDTTTNNSAAAPNTTDVFNSSTNVPSTIPTTAYSFDTTTTESGTIAAGTSSSYTTHTNLTVTNTTTTRASSTTKPSTYTSTTTTRTSTTTKQPTFTSTTTTRTTTITKPPTYTSTTTNVSSTATTTTATTPNTMIGSSTPTSEKSGVNIKLILPLVLVGVGQIIIVATLLAYRRLKSKQNEVKPLKPLQ